MIKRYMPTKFPHRDEPVMHPERDGWWVRYEDHEVEYALWMAAIADLKEEEERLEGAVDDLGEKLRWALDLIDELTISYPLKGSKNEAYWEARKALPPEV